ncbi:type VI secretion system baseplate subunit TssF [Thaumasiovibrio subtropicus]|uniref:type VI secretion system baseplate subunit TssF n=1 Tax=Thaumasiovibrio subtropicus TaxID=1891207 RepID=UPI000B364096|nr:type VI secretion system baseplate subunit TssF [Thaumasiovibrio subtropicus]
MNDEFLKYYQRELSWLRHKGGEFADRHPKIASRLKMTDEHIEDPHVSRLLEGMAFISAQIRQSLDDSFPQLTESLIGELFPDFHAPIPSMSIVHHKPSIYTDNCNHLPVGTKVDIFAPGYQTCHYRTTSAVDIWPFEVVDAKYMNAPFTAPERKFKTDSAAVLKLEVKCHEGCSGFDELDISALNFYLNGQPQTSHGLYQLLFRSLQGVSIALEDGSVTQLPASKLTSKDVDPLVPYSPQMFSGYRQLVEYFLVPEKFLFVNLEGLNTEMFGPGKSVEIFFYLSDSVPLLAKQVTADNVLLGCGPVINLFETTLEPVRLAATEYEYELRPANRKAESQEVISIDDVKLSSSKLDHDLDVQPYYSGEHPNYANANEYYWSIRREDAAWAGGFDEPGRHIFLSLINQDHSPEIAERFDHANLHIKAQVSNRNIPNRLPYGGGQPEVSVTKNADAKGSRCLLPLSTTVRPRMNAHTRWQFAKLITLNTFSDEGGLRNLKEMLKLFDFRGSPSTKVLTDAIEALHVNQTTARVNQRGRVGFCHGSEITLDIVESRVDNDQLFLFGQVMSDFFAQYAEVNSFTQLRIKLLPAKRFYHVWPAMAGGKALL